MDTRTYFPGTDMCWIYLEITSLTEGRICCGNCGETLFAFHAEQQSDTQPDRPRQVLMDRVSAAVYGHQTGCRHRLRNPQPGPPASR